MTIRYRPYQSHDAPAVKQLIRQKLTADRLAPRLLDSALEAVLHSRLETSTYAQVAVQDGRLVGVIMGRVAGQQHLPGRLGHRMAAWRHGARLAVRGLTEHRQLDGADPGAGPRSEDTADPVTLLAVEAPTRGQVIGRALRDSYLNHLRSHGRCGCGGTGGAGDTPRSCDTAGSPTA